MSTTIELTPPQRAYIDGLREMADTFEAHPEAAPTMTICLYLGTYGLQGEEALTRITEIRRAFGGRWTKGIGASGDFHFVRQFGPHSLTVYTARENVCERVVTGTRTVIVPDPDAEDARPMVAVEEEIVEWICPDSILAEGTPVDGGA